jgi:hypothetical protein
MGLDLWFAEDVARILAALAAAGDERGPEYHVALRHVAIAFGLPVSQATGNRWQAAVNARAEPGRREVITIEQDGRP